MSEWQPISTAPKDGTTILGALNFAEGYSYTEIQYEEEWGWLDYAMAPLPTFVTHWKPLPEPPKP